MKTPLWRRSVFWPRTALSIVVLLCSLVSTLEAADLRITDNAWFEIVLGSSSRFLTPGFGVTPAPMADPNPRTRSYSALVGGGGKVFWFGGGHNSYPGNDIETFEPALFSWQQSYKPEVCPYDPAVACYTIYQGWGTTLPTPLGGPYVTHTYQSYAYDPPRNRLVALLGSGTWAYDFASRKWTPLAGLYSGNTFSPGGYGMGDQHLLSYDERLGAIQAVVTQGNDRGTYILDAANGRWTKRGGPPEVGGATLYSTYAADRGVHFVLAPAYWSHMWWEYNAQSDRWTPLPDPSIVPDSFDYDTLNRVVVGVQHNANGFRVVVFDPDTRQWSALPVNGPVPAQRDGLSGTPMAWRYVASLNAFVFVEGDRGTWSGGPTKTWMYRYRNTGSAGIVGVPQPTTPAPAPPVTAAPSSSPTTTVAPPVAGAPGSSPDIVPPTTPENVSASLVNGLVRLTWDAASDNVGVSSYVIYRDGIRLGHTSRRSYTIRRGRPGDHVFSVAATDAAGNTSKRSRPVRVTVPASTSSGAGSISTPPASSAGGSTTPPPAAPPSSGSGSTASPQTPPSLGGKPSFAERCAMPGVVRCFGFDTEAEVTPYIAAGTSRPKVDTSRRSSGTGSLKMTIPALSAADTSGYFAMNFTPNTVNQFYAGGDPDKGPDYYAVQFGEGEEFYVQWRQWFTPEFLATQYAGGGGWKQIIVGEGDRSGFKASSCTALGLVLHNLYYQGFPQMYHSCGEKDGRYEGLYDTVETPTLNYKLQNAVDGCLYTSATVPPCVGYKANQWMTFQIHVKIGTWYKNDLNYYRNSTVELWVAEEGSPSRLVISKVGYDLVNLDPAAKYGKVWLTPYNTGKDDTVAYPETYTWYDDLIISRSPIPDP